MLVLGMMSGTSADGIDAALVQFEGAPPRLRMRFRGHFRAEFRTSLRKEILRIANGDSTTPGDISQLNFALGKQFGRAAIDACKRWRIAVSKLDLIGSHGQTIYHQGVPSQVAGTGRHSSTLQIGEPSVIAAMTRVPVIADFRPADMAFEGQGAPLVPFVDYLLYRSAHVARAALNIGGIANVTAIPPHAKPDEVFAFDTGPGNMIIDALIEQISGERERYDKDAHIAIQGQLLPGLLERLMRDHYFDKKPPKTAGREQFGRNYAERMLAWGKEHTTNLADLVHTATVFTAASIAQQMKRYVFPRVRVREMIVAGGGVHNPLIMAQLAAALPGIEFLPSRNFGVPEDAKEAFAFAVLAHEAWHGRPNNLPGATGATRPVVMGKMVRPYGFRKQ
jgi:anhydro-N-acetylmuramic acid kinase